MTKPEYTERIILGVLFVRICFHNQQLFKYQPSQLQSSKQPFSSEVLKNSQASLSRIKMKEIRSHQLRADRARKAFKRLDRVYLHIAQKAKSSLSGLHLIQKHHNNLKQLKSDFGLIWCRNLDMHLEDLIQDYVNRICLHRQNIRDCCATFKFSLNGKFKTWIYPKQTGL
jgi:hypothetical protein